MTAPIYPQLGSGALSQFPVQKRRKLRTVRNVSEDGRHVRLSDPTGTTTEWHLTYDDLTDVEMATIHDFFAVAEGTLNSFTFLDPTDNLLANSDELDHPVWEAGPLLTLSKGETDPKGGLSAWRLSNRGDGVQSLSQSLGVPGSYLYCFSVYVKSLTATNVAMVFGSQRTTRAVTPAWNRIEFSTRDLGVGPMAFGLELAAGSVLDVYGMQVEPQARASGFKSTGRGGVYEGARLADDLLAVTTLGQNCHSCTVNIIHVDHL